MDLVAANKIVGLLETRTNDMSRLLEHLDSMHDVSFDVYCTEGGDGRKGQGVAVLVHDSITRYVRLWRRSVDIQGVWLQINGCVFGVQGDVCKGIVYLNPESSGRSRDIVASMFDELLSDVALAQKSFGHVLLAGDFNAHLGKGDEFAYGHSALLARFPSLVTRRKAMGIRDPFTQNTAGRCLLDVASGGPMVITTGRGKGDDGQRSFKGYTGQVSSRIDHVMMTGDLYAQLLSVHLDDKCKISDHIPITLTFPHVTCTRHDWSPVLPYTAGPCFKWIPENEQVYAERLRCDLLGVASIRQAIERGDIDGANSALMSMIERAAAASGMVCQPRRMATRGFPAGKLRPSWFDAQCLEAKQRLRWAIKWGRAREQLVKEYRRVTRRAKRRHDQMKAARLLDLIKNKDPEAYRLVQRRPPKQPTPVPAESWKEHIQQHFGPRQEPAAAPSAIGHRGRWGYPRVRMDEHGRPRDLVAVGRGRLGAAGEGQAFTLPNRSKLDGIVGTYLHSMRLDAAAGPDGLPVAFVRNARVKVGEKVYTNVLHPVLCDIIDACMKSSRIPEAWKSARLTPLHKKGDPLSPGNYRLLAVSPCLYRLYANVVRDALTEWCVKERQVPDAQFGFYPGRNTLQPLFIMRHLIHAGNRRGSGNGKQLYTAFIDFSQAYDTIDRTKLWEHLKGVHMPNSLLQIVQSMYAGDTYELVDGDKRTGHISPVRGVRQGCPLSPLLFSLYVNDISEEFPRALGARAGISQEAARISHVMYADDLTLLANTRSNLQSMLDRLYAYAVRKGLTVNVGKSQVMVFNPSQQDISSPPELMLGCDMLEVVREFKFLGVVLNDRGCMSRAAEYAARPFTAGIKRVGEMADNFCVQDRPHAMMWLFQSFALSAGLYGSQVWCTPHLLKVLRDEKSVIDINLRHTGFLRRVLQIKKSVGNVVILRESGQLPMHVYWLKSTVKFWNACVSVCSMDAQSRISCPLLREVIFTDLQLARDKKQRCWTRDMMDILGHLGLQTTIATNLSGGVGEPQLRTMNLDDVMAAMHGNLQGVWTRAKANGPRDGIIPRTSGRKLVTYEHWMAVPWEEERKPPLPEYLKCVLPKDVVRDMARFRTSSHRLSIETGRWQRPVPIPVSDRVCGLCKSGAVQDEEHILLDCAALSGIRSRYAGLVDACEGDMHKLMSSECTRDLSWFVHECMRLIDAEYCDTRDYIDVTEADGEQPIVG